MRCLFPQPIGNSRSPDPILGEAGQRVSTVHEERLYDQIANELETDTVDKDLWTKAYAEAGGDNKQTRVRYIKARFARLLAMENVQRGSVRQEDR